MIIFFFLAMSAHATGFAERELRIGMVSEFPEELEPQMEAFTDYLTQKLKPYGISNVRPVITESIQAMGYLIRKGKVDLFIGSPLTSYAIQQLADTRYLLRQWWDGVPEYHSVIFVSTESPVHTLEQLKGRLIAFENPYSSSGYLIPKYQLEQHNLRLVRVRYTDESIPKNQVGYLFSYSEASVLDWVLREKVVAGATDSLHYQLWDNPKGRMRVLYRSAPMPRQLVSAGSHLYPWIRRKLIQILLNMQLSEEGRAALFEFGHTERFDWIPGGREALITAIEPMKIFLHRELGIKSQVTE
jgi:phosphonate transport system substrate-binding protein